MMDQHLLFTAIFNNSENDLDSSSFLEKTIAQFPYFGLAHFYKLKNAKSHENSFIPIAAKTNLFFNNPYFLHAQLYINNLYINNIETEIKNIDDSKNDKNIDSNKKEVNAENDEDIKIIIDGKEEDYRNNINVLGNTVENKKIDSSTLNVEKEVNKDEMLFEPLHATDYFASQGIKLSENALGNDKLGLQLKSFTSWLKTMKKVHPDKLPMVNEMVEKAVQSQAAKSNVDAEIVTEAMAEAFILQNKQVRAIEIYEKLSLLNPEKSAFFADKIDHLKK